ncbi:hypothetical protein CKM354_000324600 [Cercospora kikuchii]|uniref:Transmembrane protein n=1 Tax=Cercospora kikuchii TaxID=84275 RepID=A0A9P3CBT6_9PEZI|nr:uncharacterized protein CKM354_000324600 [Cercospora kikuchii]GIZ39881.1 hypothetical protein CKM354_000324600 [Cercospora kikuchii]
MRLHALPIMGCISLAAAGALRRQESSSTGAASTTADSGTGITGSASNIDADAGASGSQSGSFNLSKGGLIAIIVVVAFVAIIGVASTVLWVLAKRRQWNVRQSIKRASRRLTGRAGREGTRERQSKRIGMQMSSNMERGHKRGMVVQVNDTGKESRSTSQPDPNQSDMKGKWAEKLWRNDWQK